MGVLGGIDCKRVKEKKNFLINLFIYLFISDCPGFLLLHVGFL